MVQPDYIIIVEGAKQVVENIDHGIVKLFKISVSILLNLVVLFTSLSCLIVLINIFWLGFQGFGYVSTLQYNKILLLILIRLYLWSFVLVLRLHALLCYYGIMKALSRYLETVVPGYLALIYWPK